MTTQHCFDPKLLQEFEGTTSPFVLHENAYSLIPATTNIVIHPVLSMNSVIAGMISYGVIAYFYKPL